MDFDFLAPRILELLSEDNFGSWELWWSIRSQATDPNEDASRKEFVDSVATLVGEGKVFAAIKDSASTFSRHRFDRARLEFEMEGSDHPDPATFY